MGTDKNDLKQRLSPEQYHCTQESGTEPAFTGCYWNHKGVGHYDCVVCGTTLFDSKSKYDSGSGWPSFWAALDDASIRQVTDRSHGMVRTELRCGTCDAHLGHLFPDGPPPTGQRFCINSASLHFRGSEDATE